MSPVVVGLILVASIPGLGVAVWLMRRNAAALAPPKIDARQVTIADLASCVGQRVQLIGTVHGKGTIASTLRVRALWGRGGYSDVIVESSVADFELDDGTGRITVRGATATLTNERDAALTPDLQARAEAVLAKQTELRPRSWRVVEAACADGSRVRVVGTVSSSGELQNAELIAVIPA